MGKRYIIEELEPEKSGGGCGSVILLFIILFIMAKACGGH